ncbi:phage major tail tube protein [Blastochloris tepida]|uniref:Tail protein n=1 Tax=Blastochloris tepida TaxID=2233851 RepID=A0A348FYG6_9HYPH|nr:phage major tail tube protein [Blastochloris tepida]BBF92349.1 tail protein [Blastochloris tepida]
MAEMDYIIKAATVFVDGRGKLGTAEKIKVPALKKKREDHRGGGMLGTRKVSYGLEAIEFPFELSALDPHVLGQFGVRTGQDVPFTVRGYLDGIRNQEHTAIIQMRGEIGEIDPPDFEPGKKSMTKFTVDVAALKFIVDDAVIYDIDLDNDVYVVNGVDEWAPVRRALGL